MIHGRRTLADTTTVNYYDPESAGSVTEADQSRLYYHRPLRDGDVVTYEFLYEPGQVHRPPGDRSAGVPARARRGQGPLDDRGRQRPLRPARRQRGRGARQPSRSQADPPEARRSGTRVKLAMGADQVTIDLNGQAIYERPLEPNAGPPVRPVPLQGPDLRAGAQRRPPGPMAGDPPGPRAGRPGGRRLRRRTRAEPLRRARHAIIGEPFFALQAGEVVEKARSLEPAERYECPGRLGPPDRPIIRIFRLEGDFTPVVPDSRPASDRPVGASACKPAAPACPAIELVDSAKELGKLDELAAKVEGLKLDAGDDAAASERGRRALLALIQIARGDDAAAAKAIEAIEPILDKVPLDQPEWTRWPELAIGRSGRSPPCAASASPGHRRGPGRPRREEAADRGGEAGAEQALGGSGQEPPRPCVAADRGRAGGSKPRPALRHRPRRPSLGAGDPDACPDARHRRADPPMDRRATANSRTNPGTPTT